MSPSDLTAEVEAVPSAHLPAPDTAAITAATAQRGLRERFLAEQIESLLPFGFLVIAAPDVPSGRVEVRREEDGALHIALAPRLLDGADGGTAVASLPAIGFSETDGGWVLVPAPVDAPAAAHAVEQVIGRVFAIDEAEPVDIRHGNRRADHEAQVKLAALRERIPLVLRGVLGRAPQQDDDGDFVFEWGSTQVFVAPLAAPGGPVAIRVFATTNAGLSVTPELALFVARLNFGLLFGRFALDVEHGAVCFCETLLGDRVSDDELRFTVKLVADTADQWDDRIAQMFGGFTHATAPSPPGERPAASKPGQGGYL